MPKSDLGYLLVGQKRRILDAVADSGARNVRVFGSVWRGDDGPESDIDLLIEIQSPFTLFDLARLQVRIERILDHDVDVIPDRALIGKKGWEVLKDAPPL